MKKLLSIALASMAVSAFAADNVAPIADPHQFDVQKMECHCEKHHIIFDIKNGEKVSEMSKHCMINEDKSKSSVKFLDDNSGKQVKCSVKNGKLELNSCKPFNHTNKSGYKRCSKMNSSQPMMMNSKMNASQPMTMSN